MEMSSQQRTETFVDYCRDVGGDYTTAHGNESVCDFGNGKLTMAGDGSIQLRGSLGEIDFIAYGWSKEITTSRHGEMFLDELDVDLRDR